MSVTRVTGEDLPETSEEELEVVLGYVNTFTRWSEAARELDESALFATAVIELLARLIAIQDFTGGQHLEDLVCEELKVGVRKARQFIQAELGKAHAH